MNKKATLLLHNFSLLLQDLLLLLLLEVVVEAAGPQQQKQQRHHRHFPLLRVLRLFPSLLLALLRCLLEQQPPAASLRIRPPSLRRCDSPQDGCCCRPSCYSLLPDAQRKLPQHCPPLQGEAEEEGPSLE